MFFVLAELVQGQTLAQTYSTGGHYTPNRLSESTLICKNVRTVGICFSIKDKAAPKLDIYSNGQRERERVKNGHALINYEFWCKTNFTDIFSEPQGK